MYRRQFDHHYPTGINFGPEAFLEYAQVLVCKKIPCLGHDGRHTNLKEAIITI